MCVHVRLTNVLPHSPSHCNYTLVSYIVQQWEEGSFPSPHWACLYTNMECIYLFGRHISTLLTQTMIHINYNNALLLEKYIFDPQMTKQFNSAVG